MKDKKIVKPDKKDEILEDEIQEPAFTEDTADFMINDHNHADRSL